MTPEEHDHVQALEATVKRLRTRIVLLKQALIVAKNAIRNWQAIETGNLADEAMWQLYQQSPEMKTINAALASNADSKKAT